jgi:hypothetical protein
MEVIYKYVPCRSRVAHPEDVPMLIEVELFFHLLCPGRYTGNWKVPTLQETELGWILAGHIAHTGQSYKEAAT